jgi:hypothetical protein
MRNSGFWWVIIGIMIILDIYVYQAIKVVLPEHSPKTRLIIIILYWLVSITVIGVLIMMPFINFDNWPRGIRTYLFATTVGLFFAKLIVSIFAAAACG